jgi:uncharacterized membrane protein YdcZ (DUF606 family)
MSVGSDNPYAAPADLLPASPRGGAAITAVVTAVYAMVLGAAAGLVWGAVAPKLSVPALAANSDAAFHALIGADAWFLLVGGLAGALVALVAVAFVGEPGPEMTVGLALGGLVAAVIADRIGYLSQRGATTDALRALGAHPGGTLISEIDFRIRALGVLTVWPIASLAVVGLVIAINSARR